MKFTKKIAAGLLMLVLAFSSVGATGAKAADHKNPGTGLPCNNTYRTYTHVDYCGNYEQGTHTTSAGQLCTIVDLQFVHNITCTSCGAIVERKTFYCTTTHTVCNIYIENH